MAEDTVVSRKRLIDLPKELIFVICEHLDDQKSVQEARLAHSLFYKATTPILFKTVILRPNRADKLRKTILESPNVACLTSCIKEVIFNIDGCGGQRGTEHRSRSITFDNESYARFAIQLHGITGIRITNSCEQRPGWRQYHPLFQKELITEAYALMSLMPSSPNMLRIVTGPMSEFSDITTDSLSWPGDLRQVIHRYKQYLCPTGITPNRELEVRLILSTLQSLELSLFDRSSAWGEQSNAQSGGLLHVLEHLAACLKHLRIAIYRPEHRSGNALGCTSCSDLALGFVDFNDIFGSVNFAQLQELDIHNVHCEPSHVGQFLKAGQVTLDQMRISHYCCKRSIADAAWIAELEKACGGLLARITLCYRAVIETLPCNPGHDYDPRMCGSSHRCWTVNASRLALAFGLGMTENEILHVLAHAQYIPYTSDAYECARTARKLFTQSYGPSHENFHPCTKQGKVPDPLACFGDRIEQDVRRGRLRAQLMEQYCSLQGNCTHQPPYNASMPCAGTLAERSVNNWDNWGLYVFVCACKQDRLPLS